MFPKPERPPWGVITHQMGAQFRNFTLDLDHKFVSFKKNNLKYCNDDEDDAGHGNDPQLTAIPSLSAESEIDARDRAPKRRPTAPVQRQEAQVNREPVEEHAVVVDGVAGRPATIFSHEIEQFGVHPQLSH